MTNTVPHSPATRPEVERSSLSLARQLVGLALPIAISLGIGSSISLAHCASAEQVRAVDELVAGRETERGLPPGDIKLMAMPESASAVESAAEIAAASPRLQGPTLGVEDYVLTMSVPATEELLRPPAFQVIQAARSAGIDAWCVPASISDFRDLDTLEKAARHARAQGSVGGYAVHPGQVEVLNRVFAPTDAEIAWARSVVAEAGKAAAEGRGVFQVNGQMIDLPLIRRAEAMLERVDRTG